MDVAWVRMAVDERDELLRYLPRPMTLGPCFSVKLERIMAVA